jgi:hypothetical protein
MGGISPASQNPETFDSSRGCHLLNAGTFAQWVFMLSDPKRALNRSGWLVHELQLNLLLQVAPNGAVAQ